MSMIWQAEVEQGDVLEIDFPERATKAEAIADALAAKPPHDSSHDSWVCEWEVIGDDKRNTGNAERVW